MIPAYQLSLMRSSPQMSDVYLVIQQPEYSVAGMYGAWAGYEWSCQVNGNPTGDPIAEIAVRNGLPGAFNLLDGMTVFIGSAPGEWDKGIVRLRTDQTVGAGTAALRIAVSSDIRGRVVDGDYIVVLDEFRLWQRYGRILTSGSTITWYKDYNLQWEHLGPDDATRRLAAMPPVPILGPHGVKFVDIGGSAAQFYFDWADSYACAPGEAVDEWVSYGEQDHAGTRWNSAAETPGYQTVDEISGLRGFRTVLEVDDGNGNLSNLSQRRGVRYMFTLRRPGETQAGDPPNAEPLTHFSFGQTQGSYQQGYWRTSITVYQDEATDLIIIPGALVILFTEDIYSHESPYLSPTGRVTDSVGPIQDRENILFVGRIADDSIQYDDEYQEITFDVITPAEEASQYVNYPISISDDALGTDWIHTPTLTVDRAMRYYTAWHTTLTLVADLYQTGDVSAISAQDFMEGPIYSTLDSFLRDRLRARLGCDKYGRFFAEVNVNEAGFGTVQTLWSLVDDDWLEPLQIRQINRDANAAVDGGGLHYDAATEVVTPYLSRAPGDYSGYRGSKTAGQSLAIASQDALNNLIGRIREALNNEWPDTRMGMAGNWRWLDIFPQRSFQGVIDTIRGDLTGRFIIRDVTNAYNVNAGAILTAIGAELETDDGVPGVTISIPATLPVPVAIDPPRTALPPSLPPEPSVEARWDGTIMGTNPEGAFYTEIFDTLPTWIDMQNSELVADGSKSIWSMNIVNEGTLANMQEVLYCLCYCGFYKYEPFPPGLGHWEPRILNYEIANLAGADASFGYVMMDTCYSVVNQGHAWATIRTQANAHILNRQLRLIVCHTHDGWQTLEFSNIILSNNNWNAVMGRAQIRIAQDGTDQTLYLSYSNSHNNPGLRGVLKSVDGGVVWANSYTTSCPANNGPHTSLHCPYANPLYIYATWGTSPSDFVYSIDGGVTWSSPVPASTYAQWLTGPTNDETVLTLLDQKTGLHQWNGVTFVQWGEAWDWWGIGDPDSYGGWAKCVRVLERDDDGGLVRAIIGGQDRATIGKVLLMEASGRTVATENWNTVASNDWINVVARPELEEYRST